VLGRVDFRGGSVDFDLFFLLNLSFSCSFEFFLALLCHFAWLYRF
jgi:hypothetical protein